MPFATAHCVLDELAFAICGDARAQLGATIASKLIIARSGHNCQTKFLNFVVFARVFPGSIDPVRAETQPVCTHELITDAIHLALYSIADRVAVQMAIEAGSDAILF